MKNIKTFEAFFNPDKRHFDPDLDKMLFKMIGVNTEVVEDILVDIQDRLPDIHISISFSANIDKYKEVKLKKIEYKDGKWINCLLNYTGSQYGTAPIVGDIKLRIEFAPSGKMLDYLRTKTKKRSENDWFKFVLGDIDISEELETLKVRLEKLGFKDITIKKIDKSTVIGSHPTSAVSIEEIGDNLPNYNNRVGLTFLQLFATKEIN